jgi:enoyl-[acyl-carrier protein] reductase I
MPGLMEEARADHGGRQPSHSIAWGIAKTLAGHGATLAFTYQGEALGRRVKPLAESVGAGLVLPCDVEDTASIDEAFVTLAKEWGSLDFLVHAIAFSDKNELKGRYADTTRTNFMRTMLISCFSFTEAAKRAGALMPNGGSMLTLTYNGGERTMPNYNVMGVAKAALEASVRYLAVDFGPSAIRVNAISAGPIRTLAGAGIAEARKMFSFQQRHSPLRRGVTLDEIGGAALYLLSDLSTGVTGDIPSSIRLQHHPMQAVIARQRPEANGAVAVTARSGPAQWPYRIQIASHLKFATGLLALGLIAAILVSGWVERFNE